MLTLINTVTKIIKMDELQCERLKHRIILNSCSMYEDFTQQSKQKMYQCTSPTPRFGGNTTLYSNAAIVTIDIYRDGADSPWGFRLKGGIDVDGGTPLEIIKVGLLLTL